MNQALKPAPLGRGLSALFGDADASYQARPATTPSVIERSVRMMPVEWLQPGTYQPRRSFDEDALKGLAQSIQERGILEPLLVRPRLGSKDQFEIVAGERRWRAAQLAGIHEVPALIRNVTDQEALELGLIENIQRQDLGPIEEANAYHQLMEEFSYTQENLAKVVGKSRSHIANMLRMLALPPAVLSLIEKGDLSFGHARALITTKDPLKLAQHIIREGLSVRQVEALHQKEASSTGKSSRKTPPSSYKSADIRALEKELERHLGLKVKIVHRGKAGTMSLMYKNLDQFEDVLRRLRAR